MNRAQDSSPTVASPTMAGLSPSNSFASSTGLQADNAAATTEAQHSVEQPRYFFREKYAKLGVKGNFMPLAAQPLNVGLADWLAHQSKASPPTTWNSQLTGSSEAVENYRLVSTIVACVQETDQSTGKPICNADSCPKMTAGR